LSFAAADAASAGGFATLSGRDEAVRCALAGTGEEVFGNSDARMIFFKGDSPQEMD
jgi:hypothetical protein